MATPRGRLMCNQSRDSQLTAQRRVQVQGAGLADGVAPRLRICRLGSHALQRRRHLRDLRHIHSGMSAQHNLVA
jgi:hypothetical protein